MDVCDLEQLSLKKCQACEGGVAVIAPAEAVAQMSALPAWVLDESATMISRKLNCGTFVKAVEQIQAVAKIAEEEQHHPDVHLTGYRHLRIDLTTHAIGGLSENDFILAAKIEKGLEPIQKRG